MKNIKIYIILISVFTIGSSIPFLTDVLILTDIIEMSRSEIASLKFKKVFASIVISFGIHLISAIWLYTVPNIKLANKYIWALFGFSTGLMAIVIFYVVHIYDQKTS